MLIVDLVKTFPRFCGAEGHITVPIGTRNYH
jgi:hypothetical protein